MKPILVLYATRSGHARRIAEHVSAKLSSQQLSSELVNAAEIQNEFSLSQYSAAIVAASVHSGKHEGEIKTFVERHLAELQGMQTVFISISLSAAGAEGTFGPPGMRTKARADVERVIGTFLAETGWHPSKTKAVAGALLYSRYNFILRLIMRHVARQTGAPTDSSRDYEFTDWAGLERLVDEFIPSLEPSVSAC